MKRMVVFWLVIFLPCIVWAKEYESSEIDIKLNISDEYTVLTRDNLDNQNLEKFNVSKDYIKNIMKSNNIFFDIIKNDMSYEILIVVPETKTSYGNLTNASSSDLANLKEIINKETGDNMPIIYKNKYPFVVANYHDDNGYNVINYYTVMNYRGYNIQLQKRDEITTDDENELKEIINSITFKENDIKIKQDNEKVDYKIIIYSVIIGLIAGLITYFISVNISKKIKDNRNYS